MKIKQFLCCAVFGAAVVGNGAELIQNGGFQAAENGTLPGWHFAVSGKADAAITGVKEDGSNAARFVNRSAHGPNVFAMLNQFVAVEAGRKYKLTGEIRNTGNASLTVCLGRGWKTRFPLKATGEGWTPFSKEFTMTPEQLEKGKMQLSILIERPADGILLRKLALTPVETVPQVTAEDGASPVLNGSFENGPVGGVPDNWDFRISGGAKAKIFVTDENACLGGRSLKFTNASPTSPNVYGAMIQFVKLTPDKEYEMSMMLKGRNANRLLICIGKKWQIRRSVTDIGDAWKKYTFSFKVPADQLEADGRCMIALITDGLSEEMFLDAFAINPAGARVVSENMFRNERMMTLPKFTGDWKMLKAIPAELRSFALPRSPQEVRSGKMPEKFSGEMAFAYNDRGLLFFFRVNDLTPVVKSGENMWRGDSVQVRIDQAGAAAPQPLDSDLEFGVSLDENGKIHTYDWSSSSELPADAVRFSGFRDKDGYFIVGEVDWEFLKTIGFPAKRFYTFSALVNDASPTGEWETYFLTPGIHNGKFSNEFFKVVIPADGAAAGVFPAETVSTSQFSGQLLVAGVNGETVSAVISDQAGRTREFKLAENAVTPDRALLAVDYKLPLAEVADGDCTISFRAGEREIARYSARKADPYKTAVSVLDGAVERFGKLKNEATDFYGEKPWSMYVQMPIAVLDHFLGRLQRGLHHAAAADREAYVTRVEMIAPELEDALNQLESTLNSLRKGETLPETWQMTGESVTLVDGWPQTAQRSSAGQETVRPVMFSGYGHFGNMLRDLPNFPKFGENIIQIEMGPKSLFPREGKNSEFEAEFNGFAEGTAKMLEAARAAGLKVCFLISPHYAPAWWLEKHPELKLHTGFMRYDIGQSAARAMNQAFIRAFLPELKRQYGDVIHSICILNEPVYNAGLSEESVKNAFREHLRKKFGSVEKLNAEFNRSFADFDAVIAAQKSDKVVNAEFIRFRRTVMSDFARFLAEEVRAVWPEIPVHAKIMMTSSTFADHGINPEAFASFSDYNGNDNYFNYGEGGYASDWVITALGHEIQTSMKNNSIANTENHIVRDSELRPIPNDHIYTANFQQYISGASTLVTWVWVDYLPEARKNVNRDLSGNIAIRPGNVIAHGRAALDALRLAPEIAAFAKAKPEIGIVFSLNTLAYQMDSYRSALFDFYAQAAFTGHRLRFISEEQMENGDFGNLKMIFAVGASNLSRKAAETLAEFPGTVVIDSFSLVADENNRPLEVKFPEAKKLPKFIKAPELKSRFLDTVSPLPVGIVPVAEGVYFRQVPGENGSWLVNLVNYNTANRSLKLTGHGTFYDLIAEKNVDTPEFDLAPLQPMLLRFTPEK